MNLQFLREAPPEVASVLQILASAESLTDAVALELYELAPVGRVPGENFLASLRQADFIEPRNSEWSFTPTVRSALRQLGRADGGAVKCAHQKLLQLSLSGDRALAGEVIPNYLFTLAGQAYHSAAVGELEPALVSYSKAGQLDRGGEQWLAAKLATEQIDSGIVPAERTEVLFLIAINMFREGHRNQAIPIFEKIVRNGEVNEETATSLRILGNHYQRDDVALGERYLRKSLDVGEQVGDTHGLAVAYHNLGNLLRQLAFAGKKIDHARAAEAERYFLRSIDIGRHEGNWHHVAQVLHSLGLFLQRLRRGGEAERALRESANILHQTHDPDGEGQVLHSLGRLIANKPARRSEARLLVERSIEIGQRIQDGRGLVARLLTYGRLLCDMGDPKRAEGAFREALAIARQPEVEEYQFRVKVLLDLANLVKKRSLEEAERLLLDAQAVTGRQKYAESTRRVAAALRQIRYERAEQDRRL